MENAEEILQFLEEFSKRKQKTIPQELNNYLLYVALTGDPVYQWSLVKSLFKEKLLNVLTDFYETSPGIDIPPYPNVDLFDYDVMKNSLLERLDSFTSAPFTVQRICELLTYPRKQYNRVDKFMRAIEKNILVVSTREPGYQRHPEPENGEPQEPTVNGSDNNSEYNVDVEMEDMSWKESSGSRQSTEPQPSSSDSRIAYDIIARFQAKQDTTMEVQDKPVAQYETVTPPELNVAEPSAQSNQSKDAPPATPSTSEDIENKNGGNQCSDAKEDIEMTSDKPIQAMAITEVKVEDTEMADQKLLEESKESKSDEQTEIQEVTQVSPCDEISSNLNNDETDIKENIEILSNEETSSSSSDNTDGSNSPKTEGHTVIQEDTQTEKNNENTSSKSCTKEEPHEENTPSVKIQSDNYSISDVKSELPVGTEEKVDLPKTETEKGDESQKEVKTCNEEIES